MNQPRVERPDVGDDVASCIDDGSSTTTSSDEERLARLDIEGWMEEGKPNGKLSNLPY